MRDSARSSSSRTLFGHALFVPRRVGGVAYSLVMFIVVSVLSGVLIAGLFVPIGRDSPASAARRQPKSWATCRPSSSHPDPAHPVQGVDGQRQGPRLLLRREPDLRDAEQDRSGDASGPARDRGPPVLRARRARPAGHPAGAGPQLRRRRQHPGRLLDQPAVREDGRRSSPARATSSASGSDPVHRRRGYQRKIRELRYAIALEKRFSKDQILERYLNIAYYGDGAYGVEAAAKHYYGKSAKDLDLAEAAMLAGLVQNPDANNPANNMRAARDRRDVVLNRMASPEVKMITAAAGRGGEEGEVRPGPDQGHPQRLCRHQVPVPL